MKEIQVRLPIRNLSDSKYDATTDSIYAGLAADFGGYGYLFMHFNASTGEVIKKFKFTSGNWRTGLHFEQDKVLMFTCQRYIIYDTKTSTFKQFGTSPGTPLGINYDAITER